MLGGKVNNKPDDNMEHFADLVQVFKFCRMS